MAADEAARLPFWCKKHQKFGFMSRRAARRIARQTPGPSMRAYRCDAHADAWHNGHSPPAVKEGLITAWEYYRIPHWKRDRIIERLRSERDRAFGPAGQCEGPAEGPEEPEGSLAGETGGSAGPDAVDDLPSAVGPVRLDGAGDDRADGDGA